jgi:hypothetical protein
MLGVYVGMWQEALSSLELTVPLQLERMEPLLQQLTLSNVVIHFGDTPVGTSVLEGGGGGNEGGAVLLGANIVATLVLPFSVNMDVKSADLRFFLSGSSGGGGGAPAATPFAYVEVMDVDIISDFSGAHTVVNITIVDAELHILDERGLGELVRHVFRDPLVTLWCEGNVSITANMPFGDLRVSEVAIAATRVLANGMAALLSPPIQVMPCCLCSCR